MLQSLYTLGEYEAALRMCQELYAQNPDSLQVSLANMLVYSCCISSFSSRPLKVRGMYRGIRFRLEKSVSQTTQQAETLGLAVGFGVLAVGTAILVGRFLLEGGKSSWRR